MGKSRKLQPEEALQLQEEIEAYLMWKSLPESQTGGKPLPYEERHDRALRERDPKFFEDMAALCRVGNLGWYILQPNEQSVRWIAARVRIWLERNQKPVTRKSLKKLTEIIWGGRFTEYEPGDVQIGATYEIPKHERYFPEGGTGEIWRHPGIWSELDYITALQYEFEIPENTELREKIGDFTRRVFPKTAWKRIWQDPYFRDLKP
jgi:hypothetical protein